MDDPYACSDVEMDDDVLREFLLQTAETQLPQKFVVQAGVAETAQDGRTNRMSATCYIVAYSRLTTQQCRAEIDVNVCTVFWFPFCRSLLPCQAEAEALSWFPLGLLF